MHGKYVKGNHSESVVKRHVFQFFNTKDDRLIRRDPLLETRFAAGADWVYTGSSHIKYLCSFKTYMQTMSVF